MKNFLSVLKISLYITAGIFVLNFLINPGSSLVWNDLLERLGVHFIFAFVLTAVNAYFNDYASALYSWEKETQKRLWTGVIGSIVLTMIAYALVRWFVQVVLYRVPFEDFLASETVIDYVITLIVTLFISAVVHAFYFYKALQETKVKEQKIIAG
ncbi:MAG: histidine kinase, partial [Bacteroidota bacterium]